MRPQSARESSSPAGATWPRTRSTALTRSPESSFLSDSWIADICLSLSATTLDTTDAAFCPAVSLPVSGAMKFVPLDRSPPDIAPLRKESINSSDVAMVPAESEDRISCTDSVPPSSAAPTVTASRTAAARLDPSVRVSPSMSAFAFTAPIERPMAREMGSASNAPAAVPAAIAAKALGLPFSSICLPADSPMLSGADAAIAPAAVRRMVCLRIWSATIFSAASCVRPFSSWATTWALT